ncbi:MAG: antibiotic biosynthesis monooxygenase [Candidatus Sericytochromatia bacterium]
MYGLVGELIALENKRDELINLLLAATKNMDGCLSYIIAKDIKKDNSIWITEVWESKEKHSASLALPQVKEAITIAKNLISNFGQRIETNVIGGYGLKL